MAALGAEDRVAARAGEHDPLLRPPAVAAELSGEATAAHGSALAAELLNNHASGHGGVVMMLLDSAMAHAALSSVGSAREVVTMDMHIAFMRPTSGRLLATGGGRSVCFCEATVVDASGEVAARAMGTFRYRDPA
ncbi:MAG TPA: PaaI family thioesterase [Albitalea sp.]